MHNNFNGAVFYCKKYLFNKSISKAYSCAVCFVISPVFAYNKRGEVLGLLHAALTNTPALDGMDAVMLAAASRLASLSTETETKTVNPEQLANLLAQLRWLLTLPETSP